MGKRFASFYRCLAFARFWKVKFWRSFLKCQYFNDGWTDFHKKIYNISLYLYLGLFSKTGNTRVSHRAKMMTRWPGRERWPKWPIDPVTQWPSSMSDIHVSFRTAMAFYASGGPGERRRRHYVFDLFVSLCMRSYGRAGFSWWEACTQLNCGSLDGRL